MLSEAEKNGIIFELFLKIGLNEKQNVTFPTITHAAVYVNVPQIYMDINDVTSL